MEQVLSPCARGYSQAHAHDLRTADVVPVCAGVFPEIYVERFIADCCPRVRGGIPYATASTNREL